MSEISRKREALLAVYRGKAWRNKVLKMSDQQVIAIFMRLKMQGKV